MTHHAAIISIGEVLWDLFPEGARFGGAAANFACHAAALGARSTIVSAVGGDELGNQAVETLSVHGIDTTQVQRITDAPTGTVEVSLDAFGKPGFTIHAGSAWDRIAWTAELESRFPKADAIYFGTLGQRGEVSRTTIRRALDMAKSRGICRVLDVNLRQPFYDAALIRDSVARASVLKLSEDELPEVAAACGFPAEGSPETSLRALLVRYQLDLVAMTRGADGAFLVSAAETIDQPAIPITVCDTVGAGDSFTAALVVGLLRGESLKTIARVACETAAAVCAHPGAVPNLPLAAKPAAWLV